MTLMEGSSFGDNLMAVLPDVIGQTIGSMAASRMQQANRPRVDAKDQASAGGYYVDADSMPIEESPTGIRYFVQPGELVGGGQPTARRGFWGRQYDRFLKPIVDPVVSALGRAFRGGIDYTREATGAAYVALSNEITELEEVIVTGVRQTQNNVRQTWTDFSQAWSIQPQRRPLGETFFSPAPPSNPITWLNSDIGVRQANVRDEQADADGLNAMRSVTNPWPTNAGLSVRSGLERLHAGFANEFAVPFGVIDAGPGRLAEAGGLRWKSSENVTGHMMAEPTIMVGSVFIGNPQAMAGGMAPKAISIGRAEVLAAERGVWNLRPFERGQRIEQALGYNLPSNFPVIDRFENGLATSIKSLDLDAATYQNAATLNRTLTGYVDNVAGFQGRTWAGVRIRQQDVSGRALDLAIPHGGTAAQQAVIDRAVAYGASRGVTVNVIPYP